MERVVQEPGDVPGEREQQRHLENRRHANVKPRNDRHGGSVAPRASHHGALLNHDRDQEADDRERQKIRGCPRPASLGEPHERDGEERERDIPHRALQAYRNVLDEGLVAGIQGRLRVLPDKMEEKGNERSRQNVCRVQRFSHRLWATSECG